MYTNTRSYISKLPSKYAQYNKTQRRIVGTRFESPTVPRRSVDTPPFLSQILGTKALDGP